MRLTELERREFTRYLNHYDFGAYIRNKTFLITGAKGIMGSGIIKWLLLENELRGARVHIVASTRSPWVIPDYIEQDDLISYCCFGEEELQSGVDYIIHAAAPTGKDIFMSNPVESLKVIIYETDRMLQLAKEGNCTMIYLSSEEAYGLPNSESPLDETYVGAVDSLNIRNCYPLGKKMAELLCKSYSEEYGVDVRMIRPSVIQGLFQGYEGGKIENEILRCLIERTDFLMKSAGLTQKSMIYSLDAVSAVLTVLFRGKKGEVYNATNPNTFMAVRDMAKNLFEHFCPECKVVFATQDTSTEEGYLPQRSLRQNIDKIETIGFKPLTGLEHIYAVDIERFSKILVR